MAVRNDLFGNSALFSPTAIRKLAIGGLQIIDQTAQQMSQSNINSTSSFRYDPPYFPGIRSTQQIPLDWSRWENHTFFNSAESKVNMGFSKIINEYPFDGSESETEDFFDSLTGYEKYLYDSFPKYRGMLHFSGAEGDPGPNEGTYIKIADAAGSMLPSLSKKDDGKFVVGPRGLEGLSLEMSIFIPPEKNLNQVIFQKRSNNNNCLTLGIRQTDSLENCEFFLAVSSGTSSTADPQLAQRSTASMVLEKGTFHHVVANFNQRKLFKNKDIDDVACVNLFTSGNLISQSEMKYPSFGELSFSTSDIMIGSGSTHATGSTDRKKTWGDFEPGQTFSGTIDELRVWSGYRNTTLQKKYQLKNVFSTPDLKLYLKFNEPSGSYSSNNLVLDSSGNSLHGQISNFKDSTRDYSSVTTGHALGHSLPLVNERSEYNPILFPMCDDVINLNRETLKTALNYDANNPNLITRLVPDHYFLQGQFFEGLPEEIGFVNQGFSTGSIDFPGGGVPGQPQILSILLFMWAKYFDELKVFADQFSKLLTVDDEENDTVADQFLPFLANYYGFELPNFYSNSSPSAYLEGENLLSDPAFSQFSLKYVQNKLWRRILTNLNEIVRSKGTIHSVKSLIRSIGINPENNFRFREFGGSKTKKIETTFLRKSDHFAMLDFSGSLADVRDPEDVNAQGIHSSRPLIVSSFLSSSRYEIGFPKVSGEMIKSDVSKVQANNYVSTYGQKSYHGISDDYNDGFLTSGSFTFGANYRFKPRTGRLHFMSQSLMRLHSSGTNGKISSDNGAHICLFNVVATSESIDRGITGSIQLFGRPYNDQLPDATLRNGVKPIWLILTGVNVFDGNNWHIAWGRKCSSEIGSIASSSYFIDVSMQNYGEILRRYTTSSNFIEWSAHQPIGSGPTAGQTSHTVGHQKNLLGYRYNTSNMSGTFIVVGSQSIDSDRNIFNETSNYIHYPWHGVEKTTTFSGMISQISFWSKALERDEIKAHSINPRSIGTLDPITNFNFAYTPTGSFERLRMHIPMEQITTSSNHLGQIELLDTTQNFSTGTAGHPYRDHGEKTKVLFFMSGTGFESNAQVFKHVYDYYGFIDAKFDERSSDNKVRIRSWDKYENQQEHGGMAAPHYKIEESEEPFDDNRFIIENSIVQALNEDITSIFGTLDEFNDYIGRPEFLFSERYPDLQYLQRIYFNRLVSKIKIKEFFEFFKWFDDSMGLIIEKLLPKKTDFLGVQFTIESHMLERTKFRYEYADLYVDPSLRRGRGLADFPRLSKTEQLANAATQVQLPTMPTSVSVIFTDDDEYTVNVPIKGS